ncbi:MAG: ribosomal protein S18-alanine N-acetyltransferase [Deltaproteobacteria bacterium]|nr:ribosomal protein S18-alanine N-acetyltransferase [Deltaproteobacteria bacterium]
MPAPHSDPFLLREAGPSDLDAVVRVDVRSFTRHWPAKEFANHLEDPLVRIWLCEDSTGPLGYVHIRVIVDEAELLNVAVDPSARRRGVARRLLGHAQTHAREAGAERMFLEVRRDNEAALALYRRAGWEQVGIRKRYYSEDGADAVVMSIDLVDDTLRATPSQGALDGSIPGE